MTKTTAARANLVVISLSLIIFAACEVDMTVTTDGRNPPTFILKGSGNLRDFLVMEVPPDNQHQTIQRNSDRNILLWEIRPPVRGDKISGIGPITYGKVPDGFSQEYPRSGVPPSLVEGKIYEVGGTAYNANGGFIWVKIEGNSVVEIPIPGSTPQRTKENSNTSNAKAGQ